MDTGADAVTDDPAAYAADSGHTLPELLRARAAGPDAGRPFLVEVGGRSLTYGQTWSTALRWMAALGQVGVRPAQVIASFLPQSVEAHLLWLASVLLGVRFVPVNPELRGEFLRHVLRDAGVQRVFARPGQLAGLRAAGLPRDLPVMPVPSGRQADGPWAAALARAVTPRAPRGPQAGDPACVIYTSGTTGPAKGVLVTWAQLGNSVGLRERTLLCPADAYFTPWPPFHVMGVTPLAVMADVGGRVVLRAGPSVSRFWPDVDQYGCTAATIGPIARLLMDQAPAADDHAHALRSVIMGPVVPDVDVFRARFGIDVMTVYGSSEIGYPLVNRDVTGASRERLDLRRGYQTKIVDSRLREVPAGMPGELLVRPPHPALASAGYLGQPGLTQRSWHDGYFRTGDMFIRSQDGGFTFRDRLGDTIRRFGENISSTQLEAAIMATGGVLECAAVAVPDEVAGQEIHLAAVPPSGSGLDPAQLARDLCQVLPRYMWPAYISVWHELPKTPNGKIRKSQLRAAGVPAAAWRAGRRPGRPPA